MPSYSQSKADEVARGWLRQCESKHASCKKFPLASGLTLPRRLIDIGITGSRALRLTDTSDLVVENCRYATLSHCWGAVHQPLQTTSLNISEHYCAIDWDALPLTFQEAVIVSQNLGLSYLWIDSLCIIQGDKLDFEQECSRMHLIYLGCHVMIAASDARDGSDGLFPPHDNGGNEALTTSELNPSTTPETRAFVPLSSEFRRNGYIVWTKWSEALQGTLSKRGWTYQECELAPRILHYTHSGILWECRICIGAGDNDKLQPKRGSNILDNIYSPDSRMFRSLDLDRSRLTHTDIMDRWFYIAEEYSTRCLTYPLDKLPALSGIAAAIASLLNYEPSVLPYPIYLAGLWVPNLCSQLFWTSAPPCDSGQKARNALPSWSWASHPNHVSFHQVFSCLSAEFTQHGLYHKRRSLYPDPCFSFVSTDITPAGSDLFGNIHGSILNIRGSYLDLEVSEIIKQRWQPEYNNVWSFKHRLFHEAEQTSLWFDCAFVASQNVNLRFLILMQSDEWHVGIILRAKSNGDDGGHDKKADAYEKIGIFGVFIRSRGLIGNKSHFNSGFKNPALDVGGMALV